MAVKHSKVSGVADGGDTSLVRPSDWNADHDVSTILESIIRGTVDGATGNVTNGTGFSSVRNSAGFYTVTFTSAFSAAPVVVATLVPGTGFGGSDTIILDSVVAGSFVAQTGIRGVANVDETFAFIAMPQ